MCHIEKKKKQKTDGFSSNRYQVRHIAATLCQISGGCSTDCSEGGTATILATHRWRTKAPKVRRPSRRTIASASTRVCRIFSMTGCSALCRTSRGQRSMATRRKIEHFRLRKAAAGKHPRRSMWRKRESSTTYCTSRRLDLIHLISVCCRLQNELSNLARSGSIAISPLLALLRVSVTAWSVS